LLPGPRIGRAPVTGQAIIDAAPARIELGLLPTPGQHGAFVEPCKRITAASDKDTIRHVLRPRIDRSHTESAVELLEHAPGTEFRLRFWPISEEKRYPGDSGETQVTITQRADRRRHVRLTLIWYDYTIGAWLQDWLDDMPGQRLDCLKAQIEGRTDRSIYGRFLARHARRAAA
jgi:hypothetical protein